MSTHYRPDIDGLRALAVLAVIIYHSGVDTLSGGFVGVDVFFVISGYLITTLIYKQIDEGIFTLRDFYKRRAARLLPALIITLLFVLIFGFIFYNNRAFDRLGKEIFFASFGGANILYAQGIDYFAQNQLHQPLIHLWSLGVEEQFYLIWPAFLCISLYVSRNIVFPLAILLFSLSLFLSVQAVSDNRPEGYFLLQYRSFELLIGVLSALLLINKNIFETNDYIKQVITCIGLTLIVGPMVLMTHETSFPGLNALWPCLGTALIIMFPNRGLTTTILSHKIPVYIGLISYPMYLYHQPVLSFLYFFNQSHSVLLTLTITLAISISAAAVTFHYIESPIRNFVNSDTKRHAFNTVSILALAILSITIAGLAVARSGGFEKRYTYLNPFALTVSEAHKTTFHSHFNQGYKISEQDHTKALFIGDSVSQHYVKPIQLALNLLPKEIDTVTRGGCVLLKGVDFIDKFSDISCDDLRTGLYSAKKTYDYVIISQSWLAYEESVLNFDNNTSTINKWKSLLDRTVEHFSELTDHIIIIGTHIRVDGTSHIQPTISINESDYTKKLTNLKVTNLAETHKNSEFFNNYENMENVQVIEPYKIFCERECVLYNSQFSYFSDPMHISTASTSYVSQKIQSMMTNIENSIRSYN